MKRPGPNQSGADRFFFNGDLDAARAALQARSDQQELESYEQIEFGRSVWKNEEAISDEGGRGSSLYRAGVLRGWVDYSFEVITDAYQPPGRVSYRMVLSAKVVDLAGGPPRIITDCQSVEAAQAAVETAVDIIDLAA